MNMLFQLAHRWMLAYRLFELLLQHWHLLFGDGDAMAAARHPGTDGLGKSFRIAEIAGDGLLHVIARAHEPQDEEERHHRGDEIRVGHFPGAAVRAMCMRLFLFQDNDWLR